jgi:hypothetical protein
MFEDRIARGMRVLDYRMPGWSMHINLDRLNLQQGLISATQGRYESTLVTCGCVLAQADLIRKQAERNGWPATVGGYRDMAKTLWPDIDDMGLSEEDEFLQSYGFILTYDEFEAYRRDHPDMLHSEAVHALYAVLTQEWKTAILARRI